MAKATKKGKLKLSDFIPPVHAEIYFSLYVQMKQVFDDLADRDLSGDSVKDHLNSIKKQYLKGYYSLHEASKKQIEYTADVLPIVYNRLKYKSMFKKKGGQPDIALSFLVYAICSEARLLNKFFKRKAAYWDAVSEYLQQKDEKIILGYEQVKKRYERTTTYEITEAILISERELRREGKSLLAIIPENAVGLLSVIRNEINKTTF